MTKRRAEPMFFPVDLSTFGDQRFGVVATERGEPVQLVWGRFFAVAAQAYKARTEFLSRETIQLAAGLPKREPWFADQLVDANLATQTEDGLYRLAGVRDRLEAIEDSFAQKVAAGLKSAEARAQRKATAVQRPLNERSTESNIVRVTVTERSTNGECGAARSHSPPPPPSEIQSSSVPTEADTAVLDLGAIADERRLPFADPEMCEFLEAHDVSPMLAHNWVKDFRGDRVACEAFVRRVVLKQFVSNKHKATDLRVKMKSVASYLTGAVQDEVKGPRPSPVLRPLELAPAPPPIPARKSETNDEYLARRKREADEEKARAMTPEEIRASLKKHRPKFLEET